MSANDAVDLHEKPKNFLTEAEIERFLRAAKTGRHGGRDHLMMLLMYRHGLRETELCRLTVSCLDLDSARLWVERLKGSLSTHHPIEGDELRAIRRWLRVRDSRLPWLFVTERGGSSLDRESTIWCGESASVPNWHRSIRTCCVTLAATRWRTRATTCGPFRIISGTTTRSTRPSIRARPPSVSRTSGTDSHGQ